MVEVSPVIDAPLSQDERLKRRGQITALQDFMQNEVAEKLAPEIRHYFANGVYVREMHAPAGALIVGKIHKAEHITVLLAGRITITTEEGSQTLEAPLTLVAKPGMKRVGYCHTDTIWQSIHSVGEERDLEKIEAALIARDFDDPALAGAAAPQAVEAS
jgi:hypothetical protein